MINLIRGNNVDLEVTVTVEGEPYDLTDHKIWFTVKDNLTDPDDEAHILLTAEDQIEVTDPEEGKILIGLTPTDTNALVTGFTFECDVQVRTPEGKVYTLLFDEIIVVERVTKALNY